MHLFPECILRYFQPRSCPAQGIPSTCVNTSLLSLSLFTSVALGQKGKQGFFLTFLLGCTSPGFLWVSASVLSPSSLLWDRRTSLPHAIACLQVEPKGEEEAAGNQQPIALEFEPISPATASSEEDEGWELVCTHASVSLPKCRGTRQVGSCGPLQEPLFSICPGCIKMPPWAL